MKKEKKPTAVMDQQIIDLTFWDAPSDTRNAMERRNAGKDGRYMKWVAVLGILLCAVAAFWAPKVIMAAMLAPFATLFAVSFFLIEKKEERFDGEWAHYAAEHKVGCKALKTSPALRHIPASDIDPSAPVAHIAVAVRWNLDRLADRIVEIQAELKKRTWKLQQDELAATDGHGDPPMARAELNGIIQRQKAAIAIDQGEEALLKNEFKRIVDLAIKMLGYHFGWDQAVYEQVFAGAEVRLQLKEICEQAPQTFHGSN